ncbi:hypothetical protein [Sphingobium sp.]|uniref:hypothetical protein n=1 Tax=Sphingobium sp. TaxID=1912891 RepID=UPI002BF3B0D0|nr:hypothetical protein [Sphingobium sp.]HUD91454.1 hypothetical protein [Sphingobium sp.]
MKYSHVALAVFVALTGVLSATNVVAEDMALPDAPGRTQVMESCMQCHGADVILARPRSSEEWSQTVSQMIGYGAILTDDQYQTVVTYLSKNLDPSQTGPTPTPAPAPEGPPASDGH